MVRKQGELEKLLAQTEEMDRVMHNDLVRWARQLATAVEENGQEQSTQIELRAAVRCAYYALFHLLSEQCADFFRW